MSSEVATYFCHGFFMAFIEYIWREKERKWIFNEVHRSAQVVPFLKK